MGEWIKKQETHRHDFPLVIMSELVGSIWKCACGQEFKISSDGEWVPNHPLYPPPPEWLSERPTVPTHLVIEPVLVPEVKKTSWWKRRTNSAGPIA